MRGADIMVASVDAAGKSTVTDYHATKNGAPVEDGCQDWSIHFGEEKDGWTRVVVSRKLTTKDSNDRPILLTGLKRTGLLAAFSGTNSDAMNYHQGNTKKYFVDLSSGGSVTQASWSAAKSTAGLLSIELKFNEGDIIAGDPAQSFQGPTDGGQLIPSDSVTTYWEYCFSSSLPTTLTGKHMVRGKRRGRRGRWGRRERRKRGEGRWEG
jgi:hypothetical protein